MSYNSKRGIAKSFIFFGTARTSVNIRAICTNNQCTYTADHEGVTVEKVRTTFGHLDEEQLLALFRLSYMRWDEGILHNENNIYAVDTCSIHEYRRTAYEIIKG